MPHVLRWLGLLVGACFALGHSGKVSAQPAEPDRAATADWVQLQHNGRTIEAFVEGNGRPAVVVLPGLGGVQSMRALTARISRGGHRVITVRYRGMGKSTGDLQGANLHAYVTDVVDVIQALGNEPVHLIGATVGGEIAAALASAKPELIRSLVLLVTPYGPTQVRKPDAAAMAAFRKLVAGPRVRDDTTIQLWRQTLYSPATSEAILRSDLQVVEAGKWPEGDAALLGAIRSIRASDWWVPISAPILAIHGTDDRISPIENARAVKQKAGARIQLVEVDNAGHVLVSEKPERIAALILSFIKQY